MRRLGFYFSHNFIVNYLFNCLFQYLLLVAVIVAVVVAEPPPQRNYLPPQARNGPSSTYGAPSAFAPQGNGPAPVYGAPNGQRGQQDDQAVRFFII